MEPSDKTLPPALAMLSSERPRNLGWFGAAGLLFGDWGTSRLYVLGIAFLVAGRSSFYLIAAMSLLILTIGWAYTQICRLYQNGGGVYTAGRMRSPLLGVIGALLLFADYTITASLSSVEAFHYFGLGKHEAAQVSQEPAGDEIRIPKDGEAAAEREPLFSWRSPGLWAVVAILVIGAFNLLGPKHTAGYAIFTAAGMMAITLLIVVFALPQIRWAHVHWGRLFHAPSEMWHGFVYIVLALSGVEAVANLTGVMRKPVFATARKSIWAVAAEVALLNLVLAIVMVALASPPGSDPAVANAGNLARESHTEDMLAYLAQAYVGPVGEWMVRVVGGLLLLSATNTAINGLMSIMYVMSRDGEMPAVFQKLNSFGAPWVAAILAATVPAIVLLFAHDLHTLASLYAIGVVGAVAIDCSLATIHPRLRKAWRKAAMAAMALLLVAIWVTLATTKIPALIFVTIVLAIGLSLRQVTRLAARRYPKPSLLRRAIVEQLTPEALSKPRILLATAGSATMADAAIDVAAAAEAALVVCFVREVALNYKVEAETRLTLDNDPAAQAMFGDFLEKAHARGVPIIPMYDTGTNAAELIAELAAMNGVDRILMGSSRRGVLHHIIKGSFQRRIESLLPPEIHVQVLSTTEPSPPAGAAAEDSGGREAVASAKGDE
ncbi:MAG: UspA protein [Phycisphaerales bacterium]|nr:UspA protein [Phycisphaerales bacterium]